MQRGKEYARGLKEGAEDARRRYDPYVYLLGEVLKYFAANNPTLLDEFFQNFSFARLQLQPDESSRVAKSDSEYDIGFRDGFEKSENRRIALDALLSELTKYLKKKHPELLEEFIFERAKYVP